jgi:hypothetical protein
MALARGRGLPDGIADGFDDDLAEIAPGAWPVQRRDAGCGPNR